MSSLIIFQDVQVPIFELSNNRLVFEISRKIQFPVHVVTIGTVGILISFKECSSSILLE